MILIGQYDSPFVRRVAIAMRLYGIEFEHWPWSTFGDGDRIAAYNPLRRVPTLVLDDGGALVESAAILDHLDQSVGPERTLVAAAGPERRQALRVCALAGGMADKTVSLIYERVLRDAQSPRWVERCLAQIGDTLGVLESERAARTTPWWFGDSIGHADIAAACAVRILRETQPAYADLAQWPALARHADACEALPVFREIQQPLIPPS